MDAKRGGALGAEGRGEREEEGEVEMSDEEVKPVIISVKHVSDNEFVNPQVGPIVYPKDMFGCYEVADILNDLSSRLREFEATCERQQREIEGLKPQTYLQGEGYEVMGEVSVTFNRAEQEILKKLLFASYRDVQEIQKGNMIFRARFIHKFDDDELKEFGAKIEEILR